MKKKIFFVSSLLFLIFNVGFVYAGTSFSDPVEFKNPLGFNSVNTFLANVMTNLESFIVTIAIIMIVVGGIMYMLSFGNDKAMERAKNVILGAVIGLAIALSARTFLQTVWDVLGVGGGTPAPGGKSFTAVAGNVLTFLLSIVGIIAIISLVIGGIMYLTSYGDEDRIQKGKKIIWASIIGIVVSIGAVVLVKQIGSLLGYSF